MPYQAQPGFGVGYFVSGLKCHWYSQTPSESSGSVTESFPFFISGGEKNRLDRKFCKLAVTITGCFNIDATSLQQVNFILR